MKKLLVLIILLLAIPCYPADFYVRPASGEYGAEDGTSYATAFDGFSDIAWGGAAGQVGPGDTLYICGTHLLDLTVGDSGESGNVITITGACPDDYGTIDGEDTRPNPIINSQDYVTVRDLTIQNSTDTLYATLVSANGGNSLINLNLINAGTHAIYIDEGPGLLIQGCTITDPVDNGIVLYGENVNQLASVQVIDNIISNATVTAGKPNDAILVHDDGSGNPVGDGWIISGNIVSGAWDEQAFDIGANATNVTMFGNKVTGTYGASGLGVGDSVATIEISGHYSEANSEYQFTFGSGVSGLILHSSVAISPAGTNKIMLISANTTNDIKIYNNTFHSQSSYAIDLSGTLANIHIKNNDFYMTHTGEPQALRLLTAGRDFDFATFYFDYNNYYASNPSGIRHWYSADSGLMNWATYSASYESNSQNTDPKRGYNYALISAGSPMYRTGEDLSSDVGKLLHPNALWPRPALVNNNGNKGAFGFRQKRKVGTAIQLY